jgi:hypothetical protein
MTPPYQATGKIEMNSPFMSMEEEDESIIAGDGKWKPDPQTYYQIQRLAQIGDKAAIRQLKQATPPEKDIYGKKIKPIAGPDEIQREVNAREKASSDAYFKAIESRQRTKDEWQKTKEEAKAKADLERMRFRFPNWSPQIQSIQQSFDRTMRG